MALSLDQLNTKNQKNKESVELEKEYVQRPWNVNDQASQTFSGNSAVKKAHEIMARNNYLIKELRADQAGEKSIAELNSYIESREEEFLELTKDFSRVQRLKSSKGILNKISTLFFGR